MSRFRSGGLRSLGNSVSVPIQTDKDGYLGRECPNPDCEEYFKITPGTGVKGPAPCHCPYCGHEGDHNTFWTKEQLEYAKSVAMGKIMDAVREDLKGLEFEHKPRGPFGIGISVKLKPGAPVPVRWYRERNLETEIVCENCTLRYAIFGVFGWCPDCGIHNSLQILSKNLDLARKKLTLVASVEPDLVETLVADALAGIVSALDGFGRELCSKGDKPSFQNLEGARKRVQQGYGFDMSDCLTADEWLSACRSFQKRHLIAHKMGVVDEEYVAKASDPTSIVGRKVALAIDEVASLIEIMEKLGRGLYGSISGTPAPSLSNPSGQPAIAPIARTQADIFQSDGLTETDSVIFEHACRIAIEQGHTDLVSGDRVLADLGPQGISEQQIIESEEVLDGRGYIKIHWVIGPPHVYDFAITPDGFEQFAQKKLSGYDDLCADVARIIVRDEQTNNHAVAQELNQSITIIEHIFVSMQNHGLIKYAESIGGGLHMDVYWVSPELRRKIRG